MNSNKIGGLGRFELPFRDKFNRLDTSEKDN